MLRIAVSWPIIPWISSVRTSLEDAFTSVLPLVNHAFRPTKTQPEYDPLRNTGCTLYPCDKAKSIQKNTCDNARPAEVDESDAQPETNVVVFSAMAVGLGPSRAENQRMKVDIVTSSSGRSNPSKYGK